MYSMNLSCLHFYCGPKCHFEFALGIFGKHSLECLFKQRGVEGVAHHHVTPVARKT